MSRNDWKNGPKLFFTDIKPGGLALTDFIEILHYIVFYLIYVMFEVIKILTLRIHL